MSERPVETSGGKRKVGLLAVLIILAVLSVSVGFFNALYSGYQVQKAQVVANALSTNRGYAEKFAEVIQVYLDALHRQLRASVPRIATLENDPQALSGELQRLADQADAVNAVWLADGSGKIIAGSRGAQLPAGIQHLADLGVTKLGQSQWVVTRPGQHATELVLIEPVAQANGRPPDYLAMALALDEGSGIDRVVGGQVRANGTSIFLVSDTGKVLYSKNEADTALVLANLAPIRQAGATPLTDADGGVVLTGYAPVAEGKWALVTQRSLARVLSPLHDLLRESLRAAVPAFVLTLVLVCALAYAVASPLSRLSRAMTTGKGSGQDLDRLNAWYAEADTLRGAVKATLAQHQNEVGRLNLETQTDPMTGLMNRRALDIALQEYAGTRTPLAVIALDLDHFKRINDTFGHSVGDEVLIALAKAMRGGLRNLDRPFRIGGEEFIALLPTDSTEQASEVAERLRTAVAGQQMPDGVGQVTVSIGVALWPADGASQETVMQRADEALYASKEAGRNRVTMWRAPSQA